MRLRIVFLAKVLLISASLLGGGPKLMGQPAGATASDSSAATSDIEALCIAMQVVTKLVESVRAKELSAIHNEDMTLNMAVSTLLRGAGRLPPEKANTLSLALTSFSR